MLNRNFIQLDAPYALFDLLFGLLGGRVVFEGELADCIFDKCRVIVHEATAAKNHGALNIGCPVVILIPIVAIDGKADFVVSFECVDLVSCLGTMKINFVVLGVKEVIDGNGIGIAIVAVDGKNAALAIGEQLSRLFIGDGALFLRRGLNIVDSLSFCVLRARRWAVCLYQDTRSGRETCGDVLFVAD